MISAYSSFFYSFTCSINLSAYTWQSFLHLNNMTGWSIFWTNLSVFIIKVHYSIYFIKSCCMRQRYIFLACTQRAPLEQQAPSFLWAGRKRDNPAVSKHHPPARGIPKQRTAPGVCCLWLHAPSLMSELMGEETTSSDCSEANSCTSST